MTPFIESGPGQDPDPQHWYNLSGCGKKTDLDPEFFLIADPDSGGGSGFRILV